MIFTAFAAGIDARLLERSDERIGECASEPGGVAVRQFDGGENGQVATRDKFAHQRRRRLTPERLTMDETEGGGALLIPCPYIGEVNIAEQDGTYAALTQVVERAEKNRLEVVRLVWIFQKRNADRIGLGLNQINV